MNNFYDIGSDRIFYINSLANQVNKNKLSYAYAMSQMQTNDERDYLDSKTERNHDEN